MQNIDQKQIGGAIIIAGIIIAGAILLKGTTGPVTVNTPVNGGAPQTANIMPVNKDDRVLGNPAAKVSVVLYEDFQCPFCGKFFNEVEKPLRDTYITNGSVQ